MDAGANLRCRALGADFLDAKHHTHAQRCLTWPVPPKLDGRSVWAGIHVIVVVLLEIKHSSGESVR
jgi:hypothetical protein